MFSKFPSICFLFSFFTVHVFAIEVVGPAATLTISNKFIMPDGFNRSAVLVNGVYPAPLIKAKKNDEFRLNVVNQLTDNTMLRSTSIHWHGILQHGTAYADGADSVTQCPIAPGHSFLYRFLSRNQAGTYWYHSHFGTQYCDGLRGPLVIYDDNDPLKYLYDVDNENTVITLGEWYHLQAPSITGGAIADATLINGKGRYPGGTLTDLAIINVVRGKNYRIRLVSISCDPNYNFSIDGHKLKVIEADGQETVPVTVDSLTIFAGQRYSFVIEANQPVGNYWIRALPSSGNRNLSTNFINGTNSAILRYAGAQIADPTTQVLATPVQLQETDLHPFSNPAAPGLPIPGGADVPISLDLGFSGGKFTVNGTAYDPPTVPVLLQILKGAKNVSELLPKNSVYYLPRNKVIELSIPALAFAGPHPFHLHGHAFSVVQSAGVNAQPNYVNPVRRDVVSLGEAGSNVTIRFTTDNPGPWFLHCHIEFHLAAGLAIVFAEDIQDIPLVDPTPDSWKELCPIYDALPPSETSVVIVPTPTP